MARDGGSGNPHSMSSRQQQYQDRQLAAGKCRVCGKPQCSKSKVFCAKHLAAHRDRVALRRFLRDKKNTA